METLVSQSEPPWAKPERIPKPRKCLLAGCKTCNAKLGISWAEETWAETFCVWVRGPYYLNGAPSTLCESPHRLLVELIDWDNSPLKREISSCGSRVGNCLPNWQLLFLRWVACPHHNPTLLQPISRSLVSVNTKLSFSRFVGIKRLGTS